MSIVNPKTGKKIKKDGKTYNDLIKEGYEEIQGQLVKRDIVYVRDIAGHNIPINGPEYRRLIDLGYVWDPLMSCMTYVINIREIEVIGIQVPERILNVDYSKLVMECMIEGQQVTKVYKVRNIETEKKSVKQWWYEYPMIEEVIKLVMYPVMRDNIYFGPAYMGDKNCVLKAIDDHMVGNGYDIPKGLDKFRDRKGIFEDDYEELSKICSMRIKVITNNKEYVYGSNRKIRAELKLYYRNNHVETKIIEFKDKVSVFMDDPKDILKTVDLKSVTNIIGNSTYMYAVETDTTMYRKRYDEDINLEREDVYSATRYYTNKFIESNPNVSPIFHLHDNIKALETVYSHGIHWSKDYKEQTVVIDLINAYGSYTQFECYTGFPRDMGQCVSDKIGEDSMLDIINTAEGFGLVTVKSIFTDEEVTRWVSFPYIKHRWSFGNNLKIHYLLFGNRTHLNTNLFKNKEKRIWHKVIGNMIRTEIDDSFVTVDPVLSSSVNGIEIYKGLYYCSNKVHKIGKSFYPHIVGYIHNYIEIEIEKKYIELQKLGIEVLSVLVDGLTIKASDQDKVHSSPLFKIKNGINEMQSMEPRYEPVEPIKFSNEYCPYLTGDFKNKKYCLTGRPGTGKSYAVRQLYMQCTNTIILVPNNDLIRNYPGLKSYTIHMYIERHMHEYETIFIDEYTMVSQELLNQLQLKTIVLAGDEGQLLAVKGTPIDLTTFNIIELTKIYRQKCPQFQKQLEHTRQTGDISWITKTVSTLKAVQDNYVILCSTHEQIDRINKIGVNNNPNEFICGIKVDSPIRFYKTTKNYNAGEFGTIIKVSNDIMTIKMDSDEREVECPVNLFNKESRIIKLSHAITYHSVQGRTIDGPIALSELNLFDGKRMKYVGVSRARNIEQLHILEEE